MTGVDPVGTVALGLVVGGGGFVVDVELDEVDVVAAPIVEDVTRGTELVPGPEVVVESPPSVTSVPDPSRREVVVSALLDPQATNSTSATVRALAVRCIQKAYMVPA